MKSASNRQRPPDSVQSADDVGAQSLSELRKKFTAPGLWPWVRGGRAAGFTLIEMMIVLVVLTIVGTIAFAGMSRHRFEGAYAEFTDDLAGALVRSRNHAIDFQTRVSVTISAGQLIARNEEPEDNPGDPGTDATEFWAVNRSALEGGLLENEACIRGFMVGVQKDDGDLPEDCLAGEQTITFLPDGSFELAGTDYLDGQGATMVVSDDRTETVYTLIEIFPGGYIRTFDKVSA